MNNFETDLVKQVLAAMRKVVGAGPVSLHEPSFEGNEWVYLKECLDSTFVSSVGKFVDLFEMSLAEYTGAKFAISVVNGTEALHISLILAGLKPGEEVLLPALSFIATANAVTYAGGIPHFVESEGDTLGIDARKLRTYLESISSTKSSMTVNRKTGNVIRALIPMHTFGHPSDMEELLLIAKDFNLNLVEDAAESLGSTYKERHTGTFGIVGAMSFNGNKIITTGGGGAILTNDELIAQKAKYITTTAKKNHPWDFIHDEIGFNYRMPNINAALGCAQLEQLSEKLDLKRRLFKRYEEVFAEIETVKLFREPPNCKSNYWLQTLLLKKPDMNLRNMLLKVINCEGIFVRPSWQLISNQKPYKSHPRMELPIASELNARIINLPSSGNIVCEN